MYNIKRKVQFTSPAPRTFITPLSHYYCTVTISVVVMYRPVPQLIVVCDLSCAVLCVFYELEWRLHGEIAMEMVILCFA